MKMLQMLMELQFQPVTYQFTKTSPNEFEAEFEIDGYRYTAHGLHNAEDDSFENYVPEHWELSFALKNVNGVSNHDMTGTGNQYQVLGTVVAIFRQWFSKHPTNCLCMTVGTTSRMKVYTRLLKMTVPDWQIEVESGFTTTVWAYSPELSTNLEKLRVEKET